MNQRSRMRDYEPNELPSPELVRVKAGEHEEAVTSLLALEFDLAFSSRHVVDTTFLMHEVPWAITCGPSTSQLVVLKPALLRVTADPNVKALAARAPKNVKVERFSRNP